MNYIKPTDPYRLAKRRKPRKVEAYSDLWPFETAVKSRPLRMNVYVIDEDQMLQLVLKDRRMKLNATK